jgi:hypothetical protein
MKPKGLLISLALVVAWAVPSLHADANIREKVVTTFEGSLGRLAGMFGGSTMRDSVTSSVAVKGNRLMRRSEVTGQIVDLDEQKVYTLDLKKKEYRVQTFAELEAQADQARADAEKRVQQMPLDERADAPQQPTSEMTVDVDVKDTGQHKSIVGQDAREVVLTATMRHEGHTLEDGGGFVITTDEWLVPTVPALEEVDQFDLKYFQTVYGQAFSFDPQQMAQLDALFPAFKTLATRAQAERGRVQGTAVSSTTTFDSVKSAEQMREEAQQHRQQQEQQQQQQLGGGGVNVGGMFGNRISPVSTPVQQRTRTMATTRDVLSIEATVTPADLAIPAGYKEKK